MGEPEDLNSSAHQWCWGTIDLSAPLVWNPLVAEMITAASVMLELWEKVLSPRQRADLASGFAAMDEQNARLAAAFLAGVSRIGEASPSHMASFGTGAPGDGEGPSDGQQPSRALEQARTAWRDQAMRAALPLPAVGARVRHAEPQHITAAVLPRLTGCDCAGYVDGERCRDKNHRGLYMAAYALNRHGTDVLHADTVARAYRATGGPAWGAVRTALVDSVAHHVGIDARDLLHLIRPSDPLRLTAFGRLVSQSSDLARGDAPRGFASPHDTPEAISNRARAHAQEAVYRIRLAG
ncbi:HD domain-containing protein [Streptomyces sp. NRRL B-24085]|uniref:HD domain-containing protein n=1 Tax=Streptomyces sp. NRRL B-24085 TaxID=1709476 RepID=UPI0006B345CE|nr:HD domain-containing protein [Streptomyces sp. NRRL B-24085]